MIEQNNKLAIQRLTALWALNESGLGGLLHAFNSPFTGLIVGSIAMILISLICILSDNKIKTIVSALAIVLIVKAAVSPHSQVTAYFAVTFQALLGAFLYTFIGHIKTAAILLTTVGLVESAFQKIIGQTIVYGKSFWEAVDILGNYVAQKLGFFLPWSTTGLLIGAYTLLHIVVGIVIGFFCARLIQDVRTQWGSQFYQIDILPDDGKNTSPVKRRKRMRQFMFITGLFIAGMLLVFGLLYPGSDGWIKGFYAVGRTLIILILYFFILGPILQRAINRMLSRKHKKMADEVQQTFDMIPYLRVIIRRSWDESKGSGMARWRQFILKSILYTLHFKMATDDIPA